MFSFRLPTPSEIDAENSRRLHAQLGICRAQFRAVERRQNRHGDIDVGRGVRRTPWDNHFANGLMFAGNAKRVRVRGARRAADMKRAYERSSPGDGIRVLVDRLWPRGL